MTFKEKLQAYHEVEERVREFFRAAKDAELVDKRQGFDLFEVNPTFEGLIVSGGTITIRSSEYYYGNDYYESLVVPIEDFEDIPMGIQNLAQRMEEEKKAEAERQKLLREAAEEQRKEQRRAQYESLKKEFE